MIVNASVHVHISKGLYIDLDMNELWLSQKLKKINAKQNKKKRSLAYKLFVHV